MEAGIKNEKSIVVTEDVTASKVGSGLLPVYATPSMIALMEGTCAESVQSELAEGEGTVGVSVDIKHIAATPIGMKVRCESLGYTTKLVAQLMRDLGSIPAPMNSFILNLGQIGRAHV